MAGYATHEIFGREVVEKIEDNVIKSFIERYDGIFGVGCQGPDLFLYNLPMHIGNYKKNIGSRMHQEGSSRFFAYLLWNIWNAKDSEIMEIGLSYFYGVLTHYTLDSMIHPYVYARIGYDPEVSYSKKATAGLHHRLESAIDAKMIAVKEDILPSKYQPLACISVNKRQGDILAKLLAQTVRKSYRIGIRKENVTSSLKMMRILVRGFYGCSDKLKKCLERMERIFFEDCLCSNYVVADEYIKKRRVMNTENATWRNPWNPAKESKDSVWEIYDKAIIQYQEYLKILQPVIPIILQKNKVMSPSVGQREMWRKICHVAKELGNLSYHSGLSLGDK